MSRRLAGRDRVHLVRHRGRQHGPHRRLARAAWRGSPTRSSRRRSSTRRCSAPCTRSRRKGRGASAARRPVGRRRRLPSFDDARARRCRRLLGDVGEQRDRHDPDDRRRSRARAKSAASSSTATPCRRSARWRSTRASTPFDLLSISGHKIGAPKGIGALYIRRGTPMEALMFGGSQDRGRRPGTENVAMAVGLACAAELTVAEREEEIRAPGGAARSAGGGASRARARRDHPRPRRSARARTSRTSRCRARRASRC